MTNIKIVRLVALHTHKLSLMAETELPIVHSFFVNISQTVAEDEVSMNNTDIVPVNVA